MKINNNVVFKTILLIYCILFMFKVDGNLQSIILISSGFLLSFVLYPSFIEQLKKSKDVQQIKEDGPTWHDQKSGTPTMGGMLFIMVTSIVTLGFLFYFMFTGKHQKDFGGIISLLFAIIAFAAIGFIDDFKKVSQKQNLGLKARYKFGLQLLAGVLYLIISPVKPWNNFSGFVAIAVFVFAWIWIVGFSNAVNLTDGIDGLAGGTTLIILSFYLILAIVKKNFPVVLISSVLLGGIASFLWFNFKPAKIFMGDLGSLSLGAFLAAASIQLGIIWSLLIMGLVFVLETLSDIIQVSYHHMTGKRIFKMAPLHHHLELCGWSEEKINYVSYILTIILGIIYLVIFVAKG